MSDQGRPQFLPPEEPPSEPSPLLPGLSGPAGPSRPSRPDRLALAAVTAAVAAILLLGGILFFRSGENGPSLAKAGTPPSVRPSALPGPEYASVPNPCTAAGKALPADVRPVKPRRFADSCIWELLRPDRSRSLEVEFQVEKSEAGLGTYGTAAATKDFADDLDYASDGSRNGGFERDPEHLSGLGDEAFAARAFNLIVSGRTEQTAKSYDMGGAQVEVRRRNVVLTVKWRGADYPPGVRGHKKLVGRKFAYPDAKRQAISVVGALMSKLH